MSKKPSKLEELNQILDNHTIDEIEEVDVIILKELLYEVSEISDPRDESYVRHNLGEVILIVLFAVLSGANEWKEVEIFGKNKEKWLKKFLILRNGLPTDDTYRRIISKLNEKYVYSIIISFLLNKLEKIQLSFKENLEEERHPYEKPLVSCDGKVTISSKRQETEKAGEKALNTLSAYSSDWGIAIDQEFIEDKTNEITAMPILLSRIDIRETIVTWDALNTQKEIVATVIKGNGDYVGALKGNQHNLYNDVKDYFDDETKAEIKKETKLDIKVGYKKNVEKEHSGIVTREYYLTTNIKWLYNKEKWAGLKAIGMEEKTILKNGKDKEAKKETRYYIMSIGDINDFARAVRGHWGVENGLHWQLDFTFKDDKNKTTKSNGAEGIQIFKKVALAILKVAQIAYPKRTSLKNIRYILTLNFEDQIEKIFSVFSVDSLKNLLS